MRHRIRKSLCITLFFALLLSLAACSKEAAEDEPQEKETEYQTYEIPVFGIEFDCPVGFADDVGSNVISENMVTFSLGSDDRMILFHCSRGETDEYFSTHDLTAAIDRWKKTGFETFELLDSFSSPDSYGFYYIGKDTVGDERDTQLCYRYKNHGGFVDGGDIDGIINVDLQIVVPVSEDRDDFIAFCKAVTDSLRLSVLEPLKGDTSDKQCMEIVNSLFQYAPIASGDWPRLYLEQLLGGNEELFHSLIYKGGLLECLEDGDSGFDSELAFQAIEESDEAANAYSVYLRETRRYYRGESESYGHIIDITINGSKDYCITGIDSDYIGPVDDYDEKSSGGEAAASFVSIYDDEDGIYDGPPVDAFASGGLYDYFPPELEAQRTYGTNARIDDDLFNTVITYLRQGDYFWYMWKHYDNIGGSPPAPPLDYYKYARESLERAEYMEQYRSQVNYTNTPLYELVSYRYDSAVAVWGLLD